MRGFVSEITRDDFQVTILAENADPLSRGCSMPHAKLAASSSQIMDWVGEQQTTRLPMASRGMDAAALLHKARCEMRHVMWEDLCYDLMANSQCSQEENAFAKPTPSGSF